jgi:heat shock protein HslJ
VAAGCALVPDGTAHQDGPWQLTNGVHRGERVPVVQPGSITMTIDAGEIGGRAACNIYGGTIESNRGRITISALSMTEMACEEDLMASEAAYMAALADVATAQRSDGELVLAGPDVELRFTLVPPTPDE